ncbi:MAG: hypothetical protein AAGA56_18410 [Myxococcota bacterium]
MNHEVFFSVIAPPRFSRDEWPILSMRLSYLGEQRIYVPIRFAVGPLADVRLQVKNQGGQTLSPKLRVRPTPLRPADFFVLEPGETIVTGYSLRRGYALERDETYTLEATLVSEMIPAPLETFDVLRGSVTAEAVSFKVH